MFSGLSKHYPPYLELIPICLFIFAWSYAFGQYGHLPDSIPTHFDFSGAPDAWSEKGFVSVFLLPLIGTLIYILDFVITLFIIKSKDPLKHINLPMPKTDLQNTALAERIRTATVRFMYALNVSLAVLFAYLTYASIEAGLGNAEGVNSILLFLLIGIFMLLTIGFMIKITGIQTEATTQTKGKR